MIRILHFADLHLGVESYGHVDPATGLSSRLADFLSALDELVDYALGNEVDLVLFCGDAYKNREPSQTHQREFARRIARLSGTGIPVLLLVGNHDLPNALGRATAVEIFHTLTVENVTVASDAKVHRLHTRKGVVQVAALPWPRRSALLTKEEYRNATLDQINRIMEDKLTRILGDMANEVDADLPALLAAHIAFSEAKMGSEQRMAIGQGPVMLGSSLVPHAFDYIALGHMHEQQVISRHPPTVYAGSLQPVDFGEEGHQKGFYIVELDEARPRGERILSYDFHEVKIRPFHTIRVRVGGDDNPTENVLREIGRHKIEGAIVRVQVELPAHLISMLQDGEIRRALKDAHFIAAISKEVEGKARTRLGGIGAESLTPVEALKLYLESKKTSPDRLKTLLEYGEKVVRQVGSPI